MTETSPTCTAAGLAYADRHGPARWLALPLAERQASVRAWEDRQIVRSARRSLGSYFALVRGFESRFVAGVRREDGLAEAVIAEVVAELEAKSVSFPAVA